MIGLCNYANECVTQWQFFGIFISPSGLFISKVLRDFSKSTITTAQNEEPPEVSLRL